MLVLTRKSGESIKIGESVTITVVQLGRGRVRLGVAAPGTVPVHRGEIYDRIQEENAVPRASLDELTFDAASRA
jgi:carbon storage regulator